MRPLISALNLQAKVWLSFVATVACTSFLTERMIWLEGKWIVISGSIAALIFLVGQLMRILKWRWIAARAIRWQVRIAVFLLGACALIATFPWTDSALAGPAHTIILVLLAVYSLVAGFCLLNTPGTLAWLIGGQLAVVNFQLVNLGAAAFDEAVIILGVQGLGSIGVIASFARLKRTQNTLFHTHRKLLADHAEQTRLLDEATSAKSKFLAAATHDLRQPAQALALFIGELSSLSTEGAFQAIITRIKAASDNLTAALSALTDIAMLDQQAMPPRRQIVDLRSMVDRTCLTFEHITQAKGIRLSSLLGPIEVIGDPAVLFSIFANLVSNAVKYTDQGSIMIFAIRRSNKVEVTIRDTGRGISEGDHAHIYDEFFRGKNVSSNETGLGLGLAIVRRLAHLSDIPLAMTSTPGEGTRFVLTLPLAVQPSARHAHSLPANVTNAAASPRDNLLAGRHIVVLENDLSVAASLRDVLARWGATVTETHSRQEMQKFLNASGITPALLIVDHHLEPGVTGFEAIACLRERPRCRTVPILMLTGDLDGRVAKAAASQGIALMHKPLPPSRLRRAVGDLLNLREIPDPPEFATTWPGLLESEGLRAG